MLFELLVTSPNKGQMYGVDSLHPSSETCTLQNDWLVGAIDNLIALNFQHIERYFSELVLTHGDRSIISEDDNFNIFRKTVPVDNSN